MLITRPLRTEKHELSVLYMWWKNLEKQILPVLYIGWLVHEYLQHDRLGDRVEGVG